MSTSANSIEYSIYKDDKEVGHFSVNVMCRYPDYAELLKYQPLSEHTIQAWGYDEEEDEWEDEPQNLEDFLRGMKTNKWLKTYFAGEKTAEQILQEFRDIYDEQHRKMVEHFAQEREKRLKNG
jgi:hypothetical protein